MRSVQTLDSTQGQRPRASPACLALTGTVARWLSDCLSVTPSTFLSPFAPRPLRRFSARMGTLTPRQVSCPTEVSPLHVTRRLRPFCLQSPNAPYRGFHTLPLSSIGLPSRGPGFTFSLQDHRVGQAESSSSTCGRVSHLRLLSTPPLGDAVTFGFQAGERMPGEDFHLYTCALAGAQAWRFNARYSATHTPKSRRDAGIPQAFRPPRQQSMPTSLRDY
jgi:hypothetical protein